MPSAMVTFNGRITLPPDVRKQLGLKTGDNVEFVEIGNGRFAIASGLDSTTSPTHEGISDPRDWVPNLDFSPTADEPRFKELDETIQ
jgi:AbrB family looped-hinge helix DNA binding protein